MLTPELADGVSSLECLGRLLDDLLEVSTDRGTNGKRLVDSSIIAATVERGPQREKRFADLKLRFRALRQNTAGQEENSQAKQEQWKFWPQKSSGLRGKFKFRPEKQRGSMKLDPRNRGFIRETELIPSR